jgi:hypothetical protein
MEVLGDGGTETLLCTAREEEDVVQIPRFLKSRESQEHPPHRQQLYLKYM